MRGEGGERKRGRLRRTGSGREDRALSQLDGTAELYILSIVTASYTTAGRKNRHALFRLYFVKP